MEEKEGKMGTNHHPNTPLMNRRDYFASYAPSSTSSSCVSNEEEHHSVMKGNYISNYHEINYNVSNNNAEYYCYSLLEAMPLPGPTWSTTAPSLLGEKIPSKPNIEEASLVLEEEKREFGENQGGSSWWLGLIASEKLLLDHTFVENNDVGVDDDYSSNELLTSNESLPFLNELEDDLGYCLDDWLMIPTIEKGLGDLVVP